MKMGLSKKMEDLIIKREEELANYTVTKNALLQLNKEHGFSYPGKY